MNEWWNALTALQRFFYYFAVPATAILLIQTILTFVGLGGDNDVEMDGGDADMDFDGGDADMEFDGGDMEIDSDFDIDGDIEDAGFDADDAALDASDNMPGFRFFTVRGMVAFFCIFGWSGAAMGTGSMPVFLVILISILAGLAAMFLIGAMFYGFTRLQSSGNIKMNNAVGRIGTVYIPLPPQRSDTGKIQIKIQERLTEATAISDETTLIKTGEEVQVTGVMSNGTLIVKRVH